ncbi:ATP-dependent permease PDR12, partial [Colletotrichum higginsianum]
MNTIIMNSIIVNNSHHRQHPQPHPRGGLGMVLGLALALAPRSGGVQGHQRTRRARQGLAREAPNRQRQRRLTLVSPEQHQHQQRRLSRHLEASEAGWPSRPLWRQLRRPGVGQVLLPPPLRKLRGAQGGRGVPQAERLGPWVRHGVPGDRRQRVVAPGHGRRAWPVALEASRGGAHPAGPRGGSQGWRDALRARSSGQRMLDFSADDLGEHQWHAGGGRHLSQLPRRERRRDEALLPGRRHLHGRGGRPLPRALGGRHALLRRAREGAQDAAGRAHDGRVRAAGAR